MNFKILIALCLILVLVFPDAESGWGRRRRRRRRVCTKVCAGYQCYIYGCNWYNGRVRCQYRCSRRCSTSCSGKRDPSEQDLASDETQNSPSSSDKGMRIPLDSKFSDYDKNKDGRISYDEFKKALPPVGDKYIRIGFKLVDTNGDNHINCKEFKVAKLDFGREKPTCN